MKKLIGKLVKAYFKSRKLVKVPLGKNKGLKLHYSDDLNVDMMLGVHEPNTFEVFDLFVKEGMTVADIGSNVGYFTRFLSKKVGKTGQVHAFEPIPRTFGILTENIKLNGLSNVTTVNKAVSSSNDSVEMFLSHTHYMASLDSNWAGDKGGSTQVPAITLDSYFEQLGKYPDFIKMDIEGGGIYALQGMTNAIMKNEPVLFLESHTSQEDKAIGAALSLMPYNVYRVGDTTPVKNLNTDFNDKFGIYATVIGVPKSKMKLFGNWNPNQFQQQKFGQR